MRLDDRDMEKDVQELWTEDLQRLKEFMDRILWWDSKTKRYLNLKEGEHGEEEHESEKGHQAEA